MTAALAYLRLSASRTRAPLAPLAAALFALIGTFVGLHNEVGATWALTALMAGGVAAWFVVAVLAGEPEAQADITTAAVGGRRGQLGLGLVLVVCVSLLLTTMFIAYPLSLATLLDRPVFDPAATRSDVLAALLAHLACTLLGGTVGLLFAPPRVRRRATAFAAITATLLVLAAGPAPSDVRLGPIGVARALDRGNAHAEVGPTALAAATCLLMGCALLWVADRWTRSAA